MERGTTDLEQVREAGLRLAPWHLNVEITPELSTADLHEASDKSLGEGFYDPRPGMKVMVDRLYPDGLQGRSVLDCACNNGAYLFAAKESGAGPCLGIDVHDVWIEQAKFLANHRQGPSDDMRFEARDLYNLPELGLEPFDFTICTGVLYHLPNPIRALEIMAALTREVMLLTTATVPGWPDGALVAAQESDTAPLSGVYGLNWYPTGPRAMKPILARAGLEDMRCRDWFVRPPRSNAPEMDRIVLFAFRDKEVLATYDANAPQDDLGRIREAVTIRVPPRGTVLIATQGEELLLEEMGRPAWHFPQSGGGVYNAFMQDGRNLMAHLDELCSRGAHALVVPRSSMDWLEGVPQFREFLERRYGPAGTDLERDRCLIYDLTPIATGA